MTEKASVKVTANGRPSGIATAITVIESKRKSTIVPPVVDDSNLAEAGWIFIYSTINLIIRMIKIRIADIKPNIEISLEYKNTSAIFSNFSYKGVDESS